MKKSEVLRYVLKLFFALWLTVFGHLVATPVSAQGDGRAFGLNGISDWSTQHPFLDLMKSARPWIGHLPGQWGGVEFETLQADGVFDDAGWPRRLPAGLDRLETLILTDQPEDGAHLAGRYVVLFDGVGRLEVTGRGRVIAREAGRHVFTYTPGPGLVGIAIKATDPDDPIRNIRVIREDQEAAFLDGAVFNPKWVDRLGEVEVLRFMDWLNTNDSIVQRWSDLPGKSDFSYAWRGVPLSVMIDLANQIGADPWFTIPHMADDMLIRNFAETVRDTLRPEGVAYIEYSNEMWNFIFDQAQWAQRQAQGLWGDVGDGWMQFYGKRAAEVMDIWTEVYGADAKSRLKRIVSVHTGWPELEQASLAGEHARAALGYSPSEMFDAYAVTGYFGYELGEPGTLQSVLDAAQERAEAAGKSAGLSRVSLREYTKTHRFDGVSNHAAEVVRNGSLTELANTLWPYHAQAAREAGLELIMYEGGTHAAPIGDAVEDERLVSFLVEFNYSDEMGDLYREALEAWAGLTASPFNVFVDVAPPSKWGSWGALRHLDDENPRWTALQ